MGAKKELISDSENDTSDILDEAYNALEELEEAETSVKDNLGEGNLREKIIRDGIEKVNEFRKEVNKIRGIEEAEITLSDSDYESLGKAAQDFSQSALNINKLWLVDFFLTLLTYQHAGKSRYPYPKEESNPLSKYTKDYPLIKHYEEVYELQKENIENSRKFLLDIFSKAPIDIRNP